MAFATSIDDLIARLGSSHIAPAELLGHAAKAPALRLDWRALDVIVIDMDPIPGEARRGARGTARSRKKAWPSEVVVRKLALLAEEGGATIVLLTDARAPRAMPWPVALRLELARSPEAIAV